MMPVMIAVTDVCTVKPTCQIESVHTNEPINGLGEGDTAPDWEVTGDLTLKLRAERSGTGTGSVYTIDVQCTDVVGNSSKGVTKVIVPHDYEKK